MKHRLFILWCCIALSLFAGEIVISSNGGKYDLIAQQELMEFLPKVSGEEWTVVPEAQWKPGKKMTIFLGDTAVARRQGLKREAFGGETWRCKSIDDGLVITGGYPIGTLYGVYDFLKRLGVRFFAVEETFVPECKGNFRLPSMDVTRTPSYESRLLYDSYPNIVIYQRRSDVKLIHGEYNRHRLRIGSTGTQMARHPALYLGKFERTTVGNLGHTYVYYMNPKKYMKDHPEYYSMDKDGKRFFGQFCLSNPAVKEVILNELREYIIRDRKKSIHGVGQYAREVDKAPDVYKIFQMDGFNYLCLCPECKKITEEDGDAGLQMRVLNYVAKEIRKEFPGIEICAGAYCSTDVPPKKTRPESNLTVDWTNLYLDRDCYRPMTHPVNKGQLAKMNSWLDIAKISIYDYWNMGGKSYFYPPRQEVVIDAVIEDLRYFHKRGIRRFMTEYEKDAVVPQPFFDLTCYLAYELLMNVEVDAEAVINEFIRHFYGEKAAPIIADYLNRLRQGVKSHPTQQFTMRVNNWCFVTPDFLLKAYQDLIKAEALAGKESRYGKRIRELMIPLLWEVCFYRKTDMPTFEKAGISQAVIRQQCLDCTEEYIKKYGGTAVPACLEEMRKKFDNLFIELNCDDQFPGYSINDIKVFGYPHCRVKKKISEVVEDPDTPVGKAICCWGPPYAKHGKKVQVNGWLWATYFAIHDGRIPRGTVGVRVKDIPQDEKYHWYKIPQPLSCVKGSIPFWGFYGYLDMNLNTLWQQTDGHDDLNTYDIWFSAKFTGPAYVPESKQRDAIWIDRVVAIRHGAQPIKK